MSGFLEITLLLTAPLLLAASGELLLERSGSLQIGLEGTMLIGAFAAFAVARAGAGGGASLAIGTLAGIASGLLFALFAVALRADPILTGTAWNLLAAGVTGFGYRLVAGVTGAMLEIPSLESSWLGLPPLVVAAFGLPFLLDLFLSRTRLGLILRMAGESPEGIKALGYSVVVVRSAASAFAGGLAGIGGALLVLTISGTFVEGVTAGRGFLALAIVVFARWKPLLLVPASLLVGGATALQYRLQAGGSSIPYAVFLALPGLMSLAALAFSSVRGSAPKALGTEAP